jgi:hypothetical protein
MSPLLSTCYLGTRQVNLREARNVKTPADLKGIKLRMPGSKDWLFLGNALGATATPLAFGEVYLGLKTGTIDGQDNPLPSVRAAKFYEVTKQLVLTSHLVDSLFRCHFQQSLQSADCCPETKSQCRSSSSSGLQQRQQPAGRIPTGGVLQERRPASDQHPTWRLSAKPCRPPTKTRTTPKYGRRVWLTASTRPSK